MAFLDYAGLQRFKQRITPIVEQITLTGTASAPNTTTSIVEQRIKDTMVPSIEYRGDTSVLQGDLTVVMDDGEVTIHARLIGTIDIDLILTEMQS